MLAAYSRSAGRQEAANGIIMSVVLPGANRAKGSRIRTGVLTAASKNRSLWISERSGRLHALLVFGTSFI